MDGEQIAGAKDENGNYIDSAAELFNIKAGENLFRGNKQNTTIACIITNGNFTCAQMNKIAAMARGAYSRCIRPVGTMADGDSIYAVCSGEVDADINAVGTLAADVLGYAIKNAILKAK